MDGSVLGFFNVSVGGLGKLLGRVADPIDDASSERRLLGFRWFEGASSGVLPRSSFIGGALGKADRGEPGSGEPGNGELDRGELGSRPFVVGKGIDSLRGGGSVRDAAARF